MSLDWTPFVDLVVRHRSFLLTAHVRPDGDALGSMLALADTLESLGKTARMTVASELPPRYDFLDPTHRVKRFVPPGDEYRDAEVVCVLDTGTWNQLGDFGTLLRTLPIPRVVIDHHLTQDDLGATRFVDTTAEATGRLVYEAILALGQTPSAPAAHALFVALAMDTGWFRHPNTRAATFDLAARLVEAGARPTDAYTRLEEQGTLGRVRLIGLVLGRIQTACDGKVCFTEIHCGDYEATGAVPADSENLIDYTRSVAGVEVGLFFMEQPRGGVKVSFRSREIDVSRIAGQFGGGGHRLASGATLDTTLDEAKRLVLAAIASALP
jgi:bifunctional oligoribonuclease and PAP phosphatase NrnA